MVNENLTYGSNAGFCNECLRSEICYMICATFYGTGISLPLVTQECAYCKYFKPKGSKMGSLIEKMKKNLRRYDCLNQEERDLLFEVKRGNLVVLRPKAGEWIKVNENYHPYEKRNIIRIHKDYEPEDEKDTLADGSDKADQMRFIGGFKGDYAVHLSPIDGFVEITNTVTKEAIRIEPNVVKWTGEKLTEITQGQGVTEDDVEARLDYANHISLDTEAMNDGIPFKAGIGLQVTKPVCFMDDVTIMADERITEEIVKARWNACMFRIKELCEKLMV